MIDLKLLRANPALVKDSIQKRNLSLDLDAFLALDQTRLGHRQKLEELQATRNKVSKEIPTLTDASEKSARVTEMKAVGESIKSIEVTLAETEEGYQHMLSSIPNFLDPTAAIGPDESGNIVEARVGEPTKFDFEPRSHHEIGAARGWIDCEK